MDALYQKGSLFNLPVQAYDLWRDDNVQSSTSIIGTAFVLYCAIRAIGVAWTFLKPSSLPIYLHCESGSWALVTGASDGIGRAFTEELLKRGFNVLMHGRNPKKLEGIKNELSQRYHGRSIDTVVADASKNDDSYGAVVKKAKNLPGKLTVLINNVGGVTTTPQFLPHWLVPAADIETQINVNLRFPTQLTRAILPLLIENGPSLILNCGSIGGIMGIPYITTYTSSKAYIHSFSRAIKTEMFAEGVKNVEVMGLVIGNVLSSTNKSEIILNVTSQQCAASCLDRVGSDESLVYSHWKHALQAWSVQMLPDKLLRRVTGAEMKKRVEAEKKGE